MMTENVDITTYVDGKRETHNPVGRAYAPVVWDYYQVRQKMVFYSQVNVSQPSTSLGQIDIVSGQVGY